MLDIVARSWRFVEEENPLELVAFLLTKLQTFMEHLDDYSPGRYVMRINRRTGEEIPGPIDPDELLIHGHRDYHPLEVMAQFLASRAIQLTGNEGLARQGLRGIDTVGTLLAQAVGAAIGNREVEKRARRLLGVIERDYAFQFRPPLYLSEQEVLAKVKDLQREARAALQARGRQPRLHVLLTGATGFLGKEILCQAAKNPRIARVVAVVRPETLRDPKTKTVVKVLSAPERGALLLKRLGISGAHAGKFQFIAGDIEKPHLGIAPAVLEQLRHSLTHVIHCAASVSFDDPYDASYRANVLGCRNALTFSLELQQAKAAPFVSHIAIETSYIHGRKRHAIAQESALDFPRHFYNNFYELTKAMASIETDRFLMNEGLRVAQLLPSIVIGHSRTGNNRSDTKVVNAPVNAFGRMRQASERAQGMNEQVKTWLVGMLARRFPGDVTAEINLVPVDRVAAGILAALTAPEAIGQRIHLATDNRIRFETMLRIIREELGVMVHAADPTIYRNVSLPLAKTILHSLNESRLADGLERLGTIFGGYSEWGQLVHRVGNDVRILGLPIRRPNTEHAFRMLCRHNKYVQDFGRVRDQDEIARREFVWEKACAAIERKSGHEAGAIPSEEFRRLLADELDLDTFRPHARRRRPPHPDRQAAAKVSTGAVAEAG
jgi:nucleoside-diphosphate-sugar epimerase